MPYINIFSQTSDDTNIFIIKKPANNSNDFHGANAIWTGVASSERDPVQIFINNDDYIQLEGTTGTRYTLRTPALLEASNPISNIVILKKHAVPYAIRGTLSIILEPTETFTTRRVRPEQYVILPSMYGISHFGGNSGMAFLIAFIFLLVILTISIIFYKVFRMYA
jgi:hypothetical protein